MRSSAASTRTSRLTPAVRPEVSDESPAVSVSAAGITTNRHAWPDLSERCAPVAANHADPRPWNYEWRSRALTQETTHAATAPCPTRRARSRKAGTAIMIRSTAAPSSSLGCDAGVGMAATVATQNPMSSQTRTTNESSDARRFRLISPYPVTTTPNNQMRTTAAPNTSQTRSDPGQAVRNGDMRGRDLRRRERDNEPCEPSSTAVLLDATEAAPAPSASPDLTVEPPLAVRGPRRQPLATRPPPSAVLRVLRRTGHATKVKRHGFRPNLLHHPVDASRPTFTRAGSGGMPGVPIDRDVRTDRQGRRCRGRCRCVPCGRQA